MSIRIGDTIIASTGTTINTDNVTITQDDDGVITAVGVQAQTDEVILSWIGTLEEYEAGIEDGTISEDWFCYITDDSVSSDYATTDLDNITSAGQQVINNAYPRFCVNSGSVDDDGNPNLVTTSVTENDDTYTCYVIVEAPFVYTTAQGITYTETTSIISNSVTFSTSLDPEYTIILTRNNGNCIVNLYEDMTVSTQTAAPSNPATNDLWLNTSVFPELSYYYDGSGWVECDWVEVGTVTFIDGGVTSDDNESDEDEDDEDEDDEDEGWTPGTGVPDIE